MCGRFTLTVDPDELLDAFPGMTLPSQPMLAPRYNIAPTQPVAVVANHGQHQLEFFKWGLIPWFAKEAKVGARHINARTETAATSPVFRESVAQRRCLIPADGFYEWEKRESGKTGWRWRTENSWEKIRWSFLFPKKPKGKISSRGEAFAKA